MKFSSMISLLSFFVLFLGLSQDAWAKSHKGRFQEIGEKLDKAEEKAKEKGKEVIDDAKKKGKKVRDKVILKKIQKPA